MERFDHHTYLNDISFSNQMDSLMEKLIIQKQLMDNERALMDRVLQEKDQTIKNLRNQIETSHNLHQMSQNDQIQVLNERIEQLTKAQTEVKLKHDQAMTQSKLKNQKVIDSIKAQHHDELIAREKAFQVEKMELKNRLESSLKRQRQLSNQIELLYEENLEKDKIIQEFGQRLNTVDRSTDSVVSQIEKVWKQRLDSARNDYEKQVSDIHKQHQEKIETLTLKLNQSTADKEKLVKIQKKELNVANETYQVQLQQLSKKYDFQIQDIKAQYEELLFKKEKQIKEHFGQVKRDLEQHYHGQMESLQIEQQEICINLQDKIEAMAKQYSELQSKFDKLQQQSSIKEAYIKKVHNDETIQLRDQINHLENDIQHYKQALHNNEDERSGFIQHLNKKIDMKDRQIMDLNQKLHNVLNEQQNLPLNIVKEKDSLYRQLREKEDTISQLKNQILALQSQQQHQNEIVDDLKQRLNDTSFIQNGNKSNLKNDYSNLSSKYQNSQKVGGKNQRDVTLNENSPQMKQLENVLKNEIKDHLERITQLSSLKQI